MRVWKVTEESIKAMEDLGKNINETLKSIKSEYQQLMNLYEENKDGLGYHSNSIFHLIQDIGLLEQDANQYAVQLIKKLIQSAAIRRVHLETNMYGGKTGGSSASAGVIVGSSKYGSSTKKSSSDGAAQGSSINSNSDSAAYTKHVLHEINTLEDTLGLTEGEAGVLQMGGFHGQVKKDVAKKAAQFESHHIPSQGVLADNPNNLPTIAISREDHKLTDSYAGKQKKRYQSMFPDISESEAYKLGVIKEINEGHFIEIVRDEIYNIREQCGNKYDGGIKQYLEALREYIRKYGVPKAMGK